MPRGYIRKRRWGSIARIRNSRFVSYLMSLRKTTWVKMLPFLRAVIFYFAFVTIDPQGELWTTVLKCDPIICLMLFIILIGITVSSEYRYSQRILIGLVFSCIGDALLNVDLFPHGMAAFACAQIAYISAFGWSPLNVWVAVPGYVLGVIVIAIIFTSLDMLIAICLPIYTLLLLTMCWRAIDRAIHKEDAISITCAIGSVFFVISDAIIAIDKFHQTIPYARYFIMSTYYFAQFAIALSVVNETQQLEDKKSPKRKFDTRQRRRPLPAYYKLKQRK